MHSHPESLSIQCLSHLICICDGNGFGYASVIHGDISGKPRAEMGYPNIGPGPIPVLSLDTLSPEVTTLNNT